MPQGSSSTSSGARSTCHAYTYVHIYTYVYRYAAGQQQYLIRGALYLLLVPAHRATDDEADEVLVLTYLLS